MATLTPAARRPAATCPAQPSWAWPRATATATGAARKSWKAPTASRASVTRSQPEGEAHGGDVLAGEAPDQAVVAPPTPSEPAV